MVRTRHGVVTGEDAKQQASSNGIETSKSIAEGAGNGKSKGSGNKKRKSNDEENLGAIKKQKTKLSTSNDHKPKGKAGNRAKPSKDSKHERRPGNAAKKNDNRKSETQKQRLISPDIEFDWDRSQLRDPRPTPGRVRRPRYDEFDIPSDVKANLLEKFYIDEPPRPKGRMTDAVEDAWMTETALRNPLAFSHDMSTCLRKGRKGSPTYDSAGFQLHYGKCLETERPVPPNKSLWRNAKLSPDEELEQEAQMRKIFFSKDTSEDVDLMRQLDYIKDHISKYLGVPWHQIGLKETKKWEQQGFQKQEYSEWWRVPTEEERKRFHKMHAGCLFRKDLQ